MNLSVVENTSASVYWREAETIGQGGRRLVQVASSGSDFGAAATPAPIPWPVGPAKAGPQGLRVRTYDAWAGAAVPMETTLYPQRMYPDEPAYLPSVDHMLTDRVKEVLDTLLPLLKKQARLNFVAVTRVEVEGFLDPEEQSEEVVITQWVQLPPRQALTYWDRLAIAVQRWIDCLQQQSARVTLQRIAIQVRWNRGDGRI